MNYEKIMKGTIVLKDDTTINVECASAIEFAELVRNTNNTRIFFRKENKKEEVKEKSFFKSYPTGIRAKKWGKEDVLNATRIIKENIHLEYGLSNLVATYLEKNGENRKRTRATIDTFTSGVKAYLKGNQKGTGLSKKVKKILLEAGITSDGLRRVLVKEA